MKPAAPSPALACAALVVGMLLLAPIPAHAWGSLGHRTIAGEYGDSLPWPLDGLRSEDAWVVEHVLDPDTRKSTIPSERFRHYIDIDAYPEYHAGTLSHDRAGLEAVYGAGQVEQWGLAPWAIGETTDSLTAAMSTGRWDRARLWISDLCHYVGDLHQPLHCTLNYDGQLTGNNGIHYRYETRMLDLNAGALLLDSGLVSYLPDPVDAAFAIAGASQQRVSDVISADTQARNAAGGSTTSGTYYAGLWTRTSLLTLARLGEASVATASFVYTAWADAGFPAVPNATLEVEGAASTRLSLAAGPTPAHDRLELRFALPAAATPVFTLVDARGRRVAKFEPGPQPAGGGHLTWAFGGAGAPAPGVYFLHVSAGETTARTRVVVAR